MARKSSVTNKSQQFCLILGVEERTSSMSSALAQAEILSILSRYVFYTHTFLLICDFSCLNLPGMVIQGARRLEFGRKMKISCTQIFMLTEIGGFSVRCFKQLPQVRSSPAHFCGELRQGIKVNQIYTQ